MSEDLTEKLMRMRDDLIRLQKERCVQIDLIHQLQDEIKEYTQSGEYRDICRGFRERAERAEALVKRYEQILPQYYRDLLSDKLDPGV